MTAVTISRTASPRDWLRIVWAITAKDMLEAWKNRTTLALLIVTLFIAVFYRALPALSGAAELPMVRVYDAGASALIAALENDRQFRVRAYPSADLMQRALANSDIPELGLAVPADLDQAVAAGGSPELQAYVVSWVSAADAGRLQQSLEARLSALAGVPVRVRLDGGTVYLQPDSSGLGSTAAVTVVYEILMLGMPLVAHLMLEEKRTRTIEAVLVSPVRPGQYVVAKAVAGMGYTLLAAAVAFALFYTVIIQWWLAVLAAICGSLFAVACGLLFGTALETRQQFTLWAWVFFIPLLIPVFLSLMAELLPAWVNAVIPWIPSVALFNALRVAGCNLAPVELCAPQLAVVLASAGVVLGVVIWLVRRSSR